MEQPKSLQQLEEASELHPPPTTDFEETVLFVSTISSSGNEKSDQRTLAEDPEAITNMPVVVHQAAHVGAHAVWAFHTERDIVALVQGLLRLAAASHLLVLVDPAPANNNGRR